MQADVGFAEGGMYRTTMMTCGISLGRWYGRSYCGEFKSPPTPVHFTPDSYSICHRVKSGFLKSPLTLVSGAEPTLYVPGLHPPFPPTAGATITATGIMCPPVSLSVPQTAGALISTTSITCLPESVSVCSCYKYCTFGQLNAFC